jgi:hypothetical protein
MGKKPAEDVLLDTKKRIAEQEEVSKFIDEFKKCKEVEAWKNTY